MPKLPVLSGAEIVRLLELLGFVRARQRGSHVPLHREVKAGTLAGLLRQAHLTIDDLMGAGK